MEGVDADKVMKMCLIQDICEARLNDLHKLGHRYIDFRSYEKQALVEQLERLPKAIAEEFLGLFHEYANDASKEGIVARDADLLECALQAREYADAGNIEALSWHKAEEQLFRTDSAKRLFKEARSADSNGWWKGLKKAGR
jgi:putative hydrolase of HD superfamily